MAIIHLSDRRSEPSKHVVHEERLSLDDILVDEGLDLLAAYRMIKDRDTRLRLKKLVEQIAGITPVTAQL